MKKKLYSIIEKITSFKWIKYYINYLFFSCLLILPLSFLITNEDAILLVKSTQKTAKPLAENNFLIQESYISQLIMNKATFIQKIILPSSLNLFDIIGSIAMLLILWQLRQMLYKIDLSAPFKIPIYVCFRNISTILLIYFILQILRSAYTENLVKEITQGKYKFWSEYFNPSFTFPRLILLLSFVTSLFRKAQKLQEEQDLTV